MSTKVDPHGLLKAENMISLAEHHARVTTGWKSSAELCINDALSLMESGRYDDACAAALRSLSYSIGILHPDHAKAKAAVSFADIPQYPEDDVLRDDTRSWDKAMALAAVRRETLPGTGTTEDLLNERFPVSPYRC